MKARVSQERPTVIKAQTKVVKLGELPPRQGQVFAAPQGVCRAFLKMDLTAKQESVPAYTAPSGSDVSVNCCNEAGKTTRVISGFILWHLSVFPQRGENGGVITTAG